MHNFYFISVAFSLSLYLIFPNNKEVYLCPN